MSIFAWIALAASAVFITAFAVGGCNRSEGGGQEEVLAYTAMEPEQLGPLLDLFRRDHPEIKINTIRDSTGVVAARLIAEAEAPKADVVFGLAVTSLLGAEERNLLSPYAPAGLEAIGREFRDERDPPRWVGTAIYMAAFAVNTTEMDRLRLPVPKSFADLADPRYRGLVTMPNPASSGTGFIILSALLQSQGEAAGWSYLDRLHPNVAEYTHSGSKPATLAATGEHPIGVALDYRAVAEKQRGAPLAVVFPSEKSGWELEAAALIAKPNIKPAAKVFLDWLLGPAAFKLYSESYAMVSREGVGAPPPEYPPKPREQLAKNDFRWAAKNHDRVIEEWTRRYGGKAASQ